MDIPQDTPREAAPGARRPRRRRLRWLCVAAAVFTLAVGLAAVSAGLRLVTVEDSDGAKRTVLSAALRPETALVQAGFTLAEADEVQFDKWQGHAYYFIQRAFPVTVTADGATHTTAMAGGTVEQALARAGVTMGEHDYCEPLLHTQVADGTAVAVHRVEYRDTVTREAVPSPVVYKDTPLIRSWGVTVVAYEGEPGENEVTYRERIVDGELAAAQVVSITEVYAPTETLVLRKGDVRVSDMEGPAVVNNAPTAYSSVRYNVICTGYSSPGGRGSSGLGLYAGTVAVNPNDIPYGTKMFITSADGSFVYGYAIATDTGTALMEGIIGLDLFYETYRESALNGRKLLTVYIL